MSESSLRPQHSSARELSELCAEFELESPDDLDQVEITGVASRASDAAAGDLYVSLIESDRIAETESACAAVESGAVAVVSAQPKALRKRSIGVPVIAVDNPADALGPISAWVYRTEQNPARILGVTGGSNRREVAELVDLVLTLLGQSSALVVDGTARLDHHLGGEFVAALRADELHAMLARMRELRIGTATLELSGEDLCTQLADSIEIDVVSYCGGYEAGSNALDALIDTLTPERSRRAVVLVSDPLASQLIEESRVPIATVSTDGTDADWQAKIAKRGKFILCGRDDRKIRTTIQAADLEQAGTSLALALVLLEEAGWAMEQVQDAFDRLEVIDLQSRPSINPQDTEFVKGTTA